jgi:hypothetical protein
MIDWDHVGRPADLRGAVSFPADPLVNGEIAPHGAVPARVVDAMIRDADRCISALEHEAEVACALADELEARLTRAHLSERSPAWAIVHVERFVSLARRELDDASAPIGADTPARGTPPTDDDEPVPPDTQAAMSTRALPAAPATAPDRDPAPSVEAPPSPPTPDDAGSWMAVAPGEEASPPEREFWPSESARRSRLGFRLGSKTAILHAGALAAFVLAAVVRFG